MNNRKATKRALLTSVMALAMCVVMLIGTTFAWFTDTATANVNKIQSGKLDVDIVNEAGRSLEGQTLNFVNKEGSADILWEPGATFNLDSFRIVNKGNLALKYTITVSGVTGSAKLLEAITFNVSIDDGAKTPLADMEGILLPAGAAATTGTTEKVEKSGLITISGTMDKNAGNDYQNLTLDGIAITVMATQYTYEYDSTENTYDTAATYLNTDAEGNVLISNADELVYFAKTVNVDRKDYTGKTVKLTKNIDLAGRKWTSLNTGNAGDAFTFDGQEYTISNLTVSGEKNVGLFGTATAMTIKNLNVDGATVTGINHVAVIAGDALCTAIENCHVKNAVITTVVKNNDDGDKAGAIAGYLSAESNASVKNCSAENCTIKGYRDIGGIVGYANSAAVITGNTVTNCTIINDQTHNYKNYTTNNEFDANEIVGEYNSGTLDLSNTATDVTIQRVVPATTSDELANAISGASAGSVVSVAAGEYDLTADIPAGVSISGAGADKTNLTMPATPYNGEKNTGLKINNAGVTIGNATITGDPAITTSDSYCGFIDVNAADTVIDNVVINNNTEYTSSIVINRGVAKDSTVKISNVVLNGGFKPIHIVDGANGTVNIDNTEITATYTLNVNSNSSQDLVLNVTNSKLHGWTSYSPIKKATFINTEFSKGGSAYDYARPYADTLFENCTFDADFKLGGGAANKTYELNNCTYNGEKLTAENIVNMLVTTGSDAPLLRCTIIVDGTPVSFT